MINLKGPYHVDFEVTSKCNLRCNFCSSIQTGHMEPQTADLNTDETLHIIDKLAENEVLSIFITGGEPLIRGDLPQILKRCYERSTSPELVTNAQFADKNMSPRLKDAGLSGVQVSLQGPESIHNSITNVPESYEKTIDGIKNLREEGMNIVLSSVITKENYMVIPHLFEEMCEKNLLDSYRTLRLMPLSRDILKLVAPPTEVKKMNVEIKRIAKTYDVKLWDLYSGLEKGEKHIPYSQAMCKAGKTKFDILSDGSVVPCMVFKGRDFVVGNILEDDIEDLWNHPIMKELRELNPDKYTGKCGECKGKWNCYSCRAVAYNLTGDLYGDDVSCFDLLKEFQQRDIQTSIV